MVTSAAQNLTVGTRLALELLLCCARTQMDAARAERIRALLREELDWDYLLGTAFRHGMLPLLYWHLNAICPEAVPKSSLDSLRDGFYTTAWYNLFLTEELLKLLKLFAAHNIPAVPFKGPALAILVYGNLALRKFGDLDVVVFKRDLLRARDLLISRGYKLTTPLDSGQEVDQLLSNFCILMRHDDRVRVDLQWRIKGRSFAFALDTAGLQEHLVAVSLAGTTVLTFSPEDLLIVLCVHGSKHLWERLKWICDVAELIRVHAGMDWERVMEQASRANSERMLALGLYLAHTLLGATLPEQIWRRVQADQVVKSVAAQVHKRLFAEADGLPGDFERFAFYFNTRDGLRGKVKHCFLYLRRYLCLVMIPSTVEKRLLPLPASLSFLYYLFRPIRLAVKYVLKPWKLKNFLPYRIDID